MGGPQKKNGYYVQRICGRFSFKNEGEKWRNFKLWTVTFFENCNQQLHVMRKVLSKVVSDEVQIIFESFG